MAFTVGVGTSRRLEGKSAIDEAISQATASLQGLDPSLILLFCSSTAYKQQLLLDNLKIHFPKSVITGCSTSGEISSVAGAQDRSLVLMAIHSDTVKFVPGIASGNKTNSRRAGQEWAKNIALKANRLIPQLSLVFADGLGGNHEDITRGIRDMWGTSHTSIGAAAGDDFSFRETFVYSDNQAFSGSISGAALVGPVNYGVGARHGWVSIGNSRIVTKSEGNILYELDNQPAVDIYEDQLGQTNMASVNSASFARQTITYPLGVSTDTDEYFIRDPLDVNAQGALTLTADIPVGSRVFLMIGSREEAIAAAKDAATAAMNALQGKKPKAALVFSDVARKKLFSIRRQDEIEAIQSVIGSDVPLAGFYSYGEYAPRGSTISPCLFHNETAVIFLLAD